MNLSFTSANFPFGIDMEVVETPIKHRLLDYLHTVEPNALWERNEHMVILEGSNHVLYANTLHKTDVFLPIQELNTLYDEMVGQCVELKDGYPVCLLERDIPLLVMATQHITSLMLDAIDDHELINLRKQYKVTFTEHNDQTVFFMETASMNTKEENKLFEKEYRNEGIFLVMCCNGYTQDMMVSHLMEKEQCDSD